MFYPNTPRPTTQPLIATWNQDLGFNLKGSPILGNELTITLKGLTAETSYWLYVKPYIPLGNGQILIVPDESSITAFEVLTGGGETEKDVVIQLVESQSAFRVGQEYLIALRNGEQEKLQIRFLISQNAILNKTGTVVKNFPSEDWTVSGFALSTTNNKVVDQKAFENDEPLISNYVNGKIVNADLDGNTSFDNLEGRVSTNEDNKMDKTQNLNDVASKSLSRDNLEVYSKKEVDTKDTNTLTSANNYTDQEVSNLDNELHPVAKSGDYNQLNNKPDLTVLEEVLVFADLASFPATGETQKVYIAEDTGFMYRWSGSAYIQMTDQTAIWGKISGTLSNQTDLQTALNGKVSKTGDETINGVKTFSSPVGVASPEDDGDAVNRLHLNGITTITRNFAQNHDLLSQYRVRANAVSGNPEPSNLQFTILSNLLNQSLSNFRKRQELVMDAESSAFSASNNVISGGLVNSNIVLAGSSIAYADTRVQTDFGLRFKQLEDRSARRYESTILDNNLNKGFILRIWFNTSKPSLGTLFANQSFTGKVEALFLSGRLRFRLAEVDRNNAGGIITDGTPVVGNTWTMVTFSFKPNDPESFDPINDLDIFVNGANQAVNLANNGTPPEVITSDGTNNIFIATRADVNNNMLGQFDLVEIIKGRSTNEQTELAIFNQRRGQFGL